VSTLHRFQLGDLVSFNYTAGQHEEGDPLGIITAELPEAYPGFRQFRVLWNDGLHAWNRYEDLLPVQPDADCGTVFKLVGNTSSNQINTLEKTE
jgi:hypothetical protein